MNTKRIRFLVIGTLISAVLILSFVYVGQPREPLGGNGAIKLIPPAFVKNVQAETSEIGALLDSEAAIAGYFQAPEGINLSLVRGRFRVREIETADYIVGTVDMPNYYDHFDTHVYVNKNGWVIAYYLRGHPASEMVDIKSHTISGSKLKTVLGLIAGDAGVAFSEPTYYDFQYPNATSITLIAEDDANGNTFTILLPSSYAYFERSFAAHNYSYIAVDGVNPARHLEEDGQWYGFLSANQLPTDVTHTITVGPYGVLVILYRVP
jgi:hypothetical protein